MAMEAHIREILTKWLILIYRVFFSTKSHKKIYLHSLNTTSASYYDQNLNL